MSTRLEDRIGGFAERHPSLAVSMHVEPLADTRAGVLPLLCLSDDQPLPERKMSAAKLDQIFEPGIASRMGGGGNSGSSKTPQERERLDREHQGGQLDKPAPGDQGGALPTSPGTGRPEPQPKSDRQD